MTREFKIFHKIDTVHGLCEECQEETILVAIVSEFIDAQTVVMILNNISMVESDTYNLMNPIKNGLKKI